MGFAALYLSYELQAATMSELDAETAEKMLRLIGRLEDLDDLQNVYSNADISDEIMEGLE